MLLDEGYKETENELERLEKELRKEYQQAAKEVQTKLNSYMNKFVQDDKKMAAKVESGEMTQREYMQWRTRHIAVGERWSDLRKELASDYTKADKLARQSTASKMADVYATNFNFGTYQMEHDAGVNTAFILYNRDTVTKLAKENPQLLPEPGKKLTEKIRKGEAQRYNEKELQSALIQGLLQGESIPNLAKRIADQVGESNYNSAVRNARTMVTNAQNSARLDAFKRGEELGIEMEKMWLATHDSRTRDTHRELDYVQIPLDEPFENGLMEPGDMSGDPAEVYNCRCSMRSVIKKLDRQAYKYRDEEVEGMSYDEWKKGHKEETQTQEQMPQEVQKKDISDFKTKEDVISNTKEVLESMGIDTNEIHVESKTIGRSLGACRIDTNAADYREVCRYSELSLSNKDSRPMEYQVKTSYHEAYHMALEGKEWDMFENQNTWTDIEETMTECAAHFQMQELFGVNDLLPSYADKIALNLPRLKQLDKYSECKTIQDFGKIAWNDRVVNYDNKNGKWQDTMLEMTKVRLNSRYYDQYSDFINENKEHILDKLIEGNVLPGNYRDYARNELDQALKSVSDGRMPKKSGNEGVLYYNAVAQAMQEVGIK